MKYKYYIIFIFLYGCATESSRNSIKTSFSATGFAYIYNDLDYVNKIISKKLDNNIIQVAHNTLKVGTTVQITNPKNNKKIILKINKKIKYPDLYSILITQKVSKELKLNQELPFVEINEIKKNKSFIAKKTVMFKEEKRLPNKAPVTNVLINNISKTTKKNETNNLKFSILIADFYSEESAKLLRKNIINTTALKMQKLQINKLNNNRFKLIAGPYKALNLLKNDYIELKLYGFEELEFQIK